jgi:hypothetical protein
MKGADVKNLLGNDVLEDYEHILFDLGLGTTAELELVVFGLTYRCWRCEETSTPIVALAQRRDGRMREEDLLDCSGAPLLAYAFALLPDDARRRFGVGEVKERYSKTAGAEYLSNGCASCDALFGDFYLFHEDLAEVLSTNGLEGLVELHAASITPLEWYSVVQRFFFERDLR